MNDNGDTAHGYFSSYPADTALITLFLDDDGVFVNHETSKEQLLPAWGAWIEILLAIAKLFQSCVAPWGGVTCLDAVDAYYYVPEGFVRTFKGWEWLEFQDIPPSL